MTTATPFHFTVPVQNSSCLVQGGAAAVIGWRVSGGKHRCNKCMNWFFSISLRQDISHFRDVAQKMFSARFLTFVVTSVSCCCF